jgi:hypothetical protein
MLVLLPSTLGLGSAALWLHSMNWPLELDEAGLMLRNHRHVSWAAIRKIGVSRSYRDGHVCQLRIHYDRGVSKIPVHALEDGQRVVSTILAMFARVDRARALRAKPRMSTRSVIKLSRELKKLPSFRVAPEASRLTQDAVRMST